MTENSETPLTSRLSPDKQVQLDIKAREIDQKTADVQEGVQNDQKGLVTPNEPAVPEYKKVDSA